LSFFFFFRDLDFFLRKSPVQLISPFLHCVIDTLGTLVCWAPYIFLALTPCEMYSWQRFFLILLVLCPLVFVLWDWVCQCSVHIILIIVSSWWSSLSLMINFNLKVRFCLLLDFLSFTLSLCSSLPLSFCKK
jgi:hypothetical protein